jgi:uncharacterized damage-inducible protein DinB
MVDDLEAFVQIRALAETPARVAALVSSTPAERWIHRPRSGAWAPVEVLAHLADTEIAFAARVRLVLTSERPLLPIFDGAALATRAAYLSWPPALALTRFRTRRGETVELLAACSAAELARVGVHPRRGEVSLADLVALALAHDTDHVAQIRDRLGAAGFGGPARSEP